MSKDEIGKQLEELKKYLKQQELQEKLREKAKLQTPGQQPDDEPESGFDDYDGQVPDELLYEPAASEQEKAALQTETSAHEGKKSGCACGCLSFVVFLIIIGMLLPVIFSVLRMGKS